MFFDRHTHSALLLTAADVPTHIYARSRVIDVNEDMRA